MTKCDVCGHKTTASGSRCRRCQGRVRHAYATAKERDLTIEWISGAWWVFDKYGRTFAPGHENKGCAVLAAVEAMDG
ncbi:MAG: hypothetical protein KGK07_16475 [Chloroflexota bacterium]|nr:hypothetical protein [Chloroflexota bacterium]